MWYCLFLTKFQNEIHDFSSVVTLPLPSVLRSTNRSCFPFAVVNRAAALYAVDSLKDQGVCRVCPDCVNCEVRDQPTVKPKKSWAPVLMAAVGSGGMVLLSLMLSAALK